MARKKYAKIDLSKIKGLSYAMQLASRNIKSEIEEQLIDWAQDTKNKYDTTTGYGSGFKRHAKYRGLKSFYIVEQSNKYNGFYVAVGHECFIAKFLEVGTKSHVIRQNKRGIEFTVSGIVGRRPLSNIWNKNQNNIMERIEGVVQKAISRRL